MLSGFNEQTKPLTEYEKDTLLPLMIQGLMSKQGKKNAVTNSHICLMLKKQGYTISDARVRKLINHIRVNGMVIGLIASSDGYYRADTLEELDDYLGSLKGREAAIEAVRLSLEKQRVLYGKGTYR